VTASTAGGASEMSLSLGTSSQQTVTLKASSSTSFDSQEFTFKLTVCGQEIFTVPDSAPQLYQLSKGQTGSTQTISSAAQHAWFDFDYSGMNQNGAYSNTLCAIKETKLVKEVVDTAGVSSYADLKPVCADVKWENA
jgi:hypothetical protein